MILCQNNAEFASYESRKLTGEGKIKIRAEQADLNYFPHFIGAQRHRDYFEQLLTEVEWRHDQIRLFGKLQAIPRLQAWYSEPQLEYTYSGLTLLGKTFTPCLRKIKQQVEAKLGVKFNAVLANLYRDGEDSVGWHSDDEPELGNEPIIASVSLGEVRNFQLKHKRSNERLNIELISGSLLVMSGSTQRYWQHCLPKTKKPKSPRINLTFRQILLD